jgi:Na+/H+ antiporter NhaA
MNDKQSGPDLAQPLERGFEQLTEPFNRFVSSQTSGIILLLAGMGFTMSIFIAILSFDNQPELLTEAKASIIRATATAGLMGFVWLRFLSYRNKSSRNPLN